MADSYTPRSGSSASWETYHEPAVDLLQDLLLIERHGLSFPLLYPLLLQFLAGVHLPRGSYLAGTHLRRRIYIKANKERQEVTTRGRQNQLLKLFLARL